MDSSSPWDWVSSMTRSVAVSALADAAGWPCPSETDGVGVGAGSNTMSTGALTTNGPGMNGVGAAGGCEFHVGGGVGVAVGAAPGGAVGVAVGVGVGVSVGFGVAVGF